MLSEGQLKGIIREQEPDAFCRNYLFNDDAWIFSAEAGIVKEAVYADLKNLISQQFDSAPNNIVLVGSAKIGRSLNPKRKFKTFNRVGSSSGERSDLDLVIVNDRLFDDTWRALLAEHYKGRLKGKDHNRDIFRRFASLRDTETYSGELREFSVQINELKRNIQMQLLIDFPVNYRIYKTMDDAFAYHKYGVEQLRREIINAE